MRETYSELRFSFDCPKGDKKEIVLGKFLKRNFSLVVRPGEFFDPELSNTVKISGICSRRGGRTVVGILSRLGYVEEVMFEDLEKRTVIDTANGPVIKAPGWVKQFRPLTV